MSNIAEIPREKLKEILAKTGDSLLQDPDRCEGLLKDHCGPHRREISALVGALEERVPLELRSSWQSAMTPEAMRARLVQRLQDNRGLAPDVANWAVDAWSYALGVGLGRRSDRLESEVITGAVPLIGVPPVVPPAGIPGVPPQSQEAANAAWVREFGSQPQPPPVTPVPVPVPVNAKKWGTGTKASAAVVAAAILYLLIPSSNPQPCPAGQVRAANGSCQAVPPPPPPQPVKPTEPKVTASIIAGTSIPVSVSEELNSDTVKVGQYIKGTIKTAVMVDGKTAIPEGTTVVLQVKGLDQAGKLLGAAKIDLALVEMSIGGKKYTIESGPTIVKGPSKTASTAKKTGIFAGIGAAAGCGIGHVTGHKCGTGAAVGGGAGAEAPESWVSSRDKPKPAELKAGSVLKFKLDQPVNLLG